MDAERPATTGRRRELELLDAGWRSASAGALQVTRVRGEPGIGKTALLEAATERLRGRGGRVVTTRGRPDAPPLAALSRLVRALVADHDAAAVRAALGVDALPLRALAPELAVERRRGDAGERRDSYRLAESLGRLLVWASAQAPLALVIDDAHALDRASRALVRSLLIDRPPAAVLVLLAERDEPGDERIALGPGGATTIQLVGLRAADLADFVEQACGARPTPPVLAQLEAHTGGNPGLLRDLLDAGGLAEVEAGRVPPAPESARALATGRLRWFLSSTPRAARVLRAAAVLGEDVQLDVTAVVSTPLAGTSLPEVLSRAEAARLLRRTARGSWRFTPGARFVLLEGFPHDIASMYHRRAARHLRATATARVGAAARVAEHLVAAVAPGEGADRQCVEWTCRAADDLMAAGEYSRAARLCRRAADLLGNGFAGDRAALLLRLGRAQWGAVGPEPARASLLDAAAVAAAARDAGSMDVAEAATLLAEAAVAYARTVEPLGRWTDEARRLLEQARAGGGAATPVKRVLAAAALESAPWGPKDGPVRLGASEEAIRQARLARDPPRLLQARMLRHTELLRMGNRVAADEEFGACLSLGFQPHAGTAWCLEAVRAARALLDGRAGDAAGHSARALSLATGDRRAAEASAAMVEFVHAREAGGLGRLLPTVEALLDEHPDLPLWHLVRARVLVDLGRRPDAHAGIARFLGDGLDRLPGGEDWLPLTVLLAETVARLDDVAGAGSLYDLLLPWADSVAVWGTSSLVLGSVARHLGELGLVLGRPSSAATHLERARRIENRLGSPLLVARSTLLASRALAANAGPEQRSEAVRWRDEAVEIARAHGLVALLADAEETWPAPASPAVSRGSPPRRPTPAPLAAPPATVVRCFGTFSLSVGGVPVDASALPPRLRMLVWYLAVHADGAVHAETVMEALWPETDPITGRHNVQAAVSSLRRVLEPDGRRGRWTVLERDGEGYRLNLGPEGSSDLLSFEVVAAAARASRDPEAAAQALAAYGGALIPEAGPVGWLVERREACRRAAADVALLLGEALLAAGDEAGAVEACRAGLVIDRYADGLWRTLIAAAEAKGDRAVAGRADRDYRVVLSELGVLNP